MTHARTVLILSIGLTLAAAGPVQACPFCEGPVQTLSERWQEASVVVVARCRPARPGEDASVEYEVLSVERDAEKVLRTGDRIVLSESSTPGREVLLFGSRTAGEDVNWGEILESDTAVLEYIRNAPLKDAKERLAYFQAFLGHETPTISNDAWGEFANAPYEEIVPVAREFDPTRLRKWLDTPGRVAHYSLFGMMLGLCGRPEDTAALEQRALKLEGEDAVTQGVDGITGGYLLLAGEPGLAKLEKAVLHNPAASQYAVLDRLKAVRFLWTYGEGRIPRERLKLSVRRLLDRKDMAESVLPDLSRWKDCSSVDTVAALYGTPDFHRRSQKQTVVRFLLTCAQDVPKGEQPSEAALKARKHIEALQKREPALVEPILKLYGPLLVNDK